jgi:simple sugar transport system permease protein
LAAINIPAYVYKMIPYIATLVVLAFSSKLSQAPKAEGIPYDKGRR